jgi:hypothetical protein
MTEFSPEPIISMRGETIDVAASSAEELIEAGKRLRYPYLVIRGQERQIAEGVERMLAGLSQPNKTEE